MPADSLSVSWGRYINTICIISQNQAATNTYHESIGIAHDAGVVQITIATARFRRDIAIVCFIAVNLNLGSASLFFVFKSFKL
jgi:hypothetical protein